MYRLVFLSGPLKGKRLVIRNGNVEIGRDVNCSIALPDDAVAGRHVVLEQERKGVFLRRLALTYSVFVNGADVREAQLNHGDEVDIGSSRILFQQIYGAPVGERRRLGKVHRLTSFSVALILFAQTMLLLGLFLFWRMDPLNQVDFSAVTDLDIEEHVLEEDIRDMLSEEEESLIASMHARHREAPVETLDPSRYRTMQSSFLPLRFDAPEMAIQP